MSISALPLSHIFQDDGLSVTAAEPWFKGKMSVIQQYLTSFVGSLAGRVDDIIFIDLYAGNGIYSLGARKELFFAPSLMSLSLGLPISKYVFCESDQQQSHLLKVRTNKYFRGKNVVLLEGKPEELYDKFKMYVPVNANGHRVAIFCLCDPFSLEMDFNTLTKLADLGFNFLIPFTFVLNDRLNYRYYLRENRDKLNRYLGIVPGNDKLDSIESNVQFYRRVVQIYENNMLALGLNTSVTTHKVDSGLMDISSYAIGLFSKKFSTKAIENDVRSMRHLQFDLFG